MIIDILMFDWKGKNGSLDHMAKVENFGFDSIVLEASSYLVSNIRIPLLFSVVFKKMEQ